MLSGNADLALNKQELMEGVQHVVIPFPLSTLSYFSSLLSKMSILIFFYMVTFYNSKKFLNILLGIAALLPEVLNGVQATSRAYLFFFVLNIIVCILIFKKQMHPKTLRVLGFLGIAVVSLLVIFVIGITTMRFTGKEELSILGNADLMFWQYKYFGESFVNFNGILYDKIDGVMYGDRNFSFFKNILGFNNIETLIDVRESGENITGIPNYIFYLFVGQLYLDFGKFFTFLIAVVAGLWGLRFFKYQSYFPFSKLILLLLYYNMCVQGIFFYPYTLQTGNLTIVTYLIIYFYFKVDFNKVKPFVAK
jgi:oligosaccharide repeat unit polymerase